MWQYVLPYQGFNPFVAGCFGHKYPKGDLTTLNILKAIKAVLIKLCIFLLQNIRNLLGVQNICRCQHILADVSIFIEPVFLFVFFCDLFRKDLEHEYLRFSDHQTLKFK